MNAAVNQILLVVADILKVESASGGAVLLQILTRESGQQSLTEIAESPTQWYESAVVAAKILMCYF